MMFSTSMRSTCLTRHETGGDAMNQPFQPVRWQDIAARYDARGLPFLAYFFEAEGGAARAGRRGGRRA